MLSDNTKYAYRHATSDFWIPLPPTQNIPRKGGGRNYRVLAESETRVNVSTSAVIDGSTANQRAQKIAAVFKSHRSSILALRQLVLLIPTASA